jgi:hypothetical protein
MGLAGVVGEASPKELHTTYRLKGGYSNQLSYNPKCWVGQDSHLRWLNPITLFLSSLAGEVGE